MVNVLNRIFGQESEGKEMIPNFIVIHHSKTRDTQTVSWSAIRRYHIHQMGWLDVGYHFGIELVGGHDGYEIFVGRMMDKQGAHCRHKSMNKKSLGICFIGDFDERGVPERQWQEGVRLVKCLMSIFSIEEQNVLGHGEVADDNRSCPGSMFDMDAFRTAISHS